MSERSIKIPALPCKLDGQGHYTVWRDLATRMLKVHDLWNLVNGSSKRPVLTTTTTTVPTTTQQASGSAAEAEEDEEETSDNAEEISDWDKKDNLAVVFLQSNIEFEVILTLTPADTAHHLWTQLEDRFDRKTVTSLHSLLANVVTLQYTPDKGIKEHLTQFNTLWSSLLTRTSNSTDKTKDL
ncbi:uncharacterized protein LAJ45_00946 [Morchella importuna]|uniref:uncharacterized protein n=1 Tax=Morchella importuna TaxID=1174673 RepID=UPI001E8E9138|nr:uncharacterized protein LAJ45_00946 [Morchella importuna]KAH8154419.1 hypothetical protein LAJ45_00946 [Morchella importuna]